MTKVVPSNYHQLLWYPTPGGDSGYKRGPGHVQEHCHCDSKEVRWDLKDKSGLESKPPLEEAEADC